MSPEEALNYHETKDRMKRMLKYLFEDMEKYKLSEKMKPEYFKKQQRIFEAANEFFEAANSIISLKQYVIYYSSEDLKNERAMLYNNSKANNEDLKRNYSELFAQNEALKRTIDQLRKSY